MRIFYGKGAYRRASGNLPELKLINMFVEPSPIDEEGIVLLSRRGLAVTAAPSGEAVRGVFREDGVFNGDTFSVAGTTLYREGVILGTISGSAAVSFAASATELGVNAGAGIYRYDGTSLTLVSFPDGASVRKILYHDGQFFALRSPDDEFYASDVLDLASWNALSFKSAESQPDALLDAEFLEDILYLFGSATVEPWTNDGSESTVPYSRQDVAIIEKGVRDTGCLVKVDQGLWFVSNENMAMVIRGGAPERISDNSLEERIGASASVSCFGYVYEGHSYFGIRLDSGTWFIDIATSEIYEGQTLGLPNLLVQCSTPPGKTPIFGGSDGKLYELGGWADGAYPLERRFTAAIPLSGGTLSVDVLAIEANTGWADDPSVNPIVEMRSSRDGGATWGQWRQCSLGTQGSYRDRVRYRRLGMFDEPGAMFDFRTVGPWGFRVSGVFVNEAGGGRSR